MDTDLLLCLINSILAAPAVLHLNADLKTASDEDHDFVVLLTCLADTHHLASMGLNIKVQFNYFS